MICDYCNDNGHYWFADDDIELTPTETAKYGEYGGCDMRLVFALGTVCMCGCEELEHHRAIQGQLQVILEVCKCEHARVNHRNQKGVCHECSCRKWIEKVNVEEAL